MIIHIAPQLPPALCGVGDYATLLGRKIEELRSDTKCVYLGCGHHNKGSISDTVGIGNTIGDCDPERMWQAVELLIETFSADDVRIVVHYSGYGYQSDGAPEWLACALEQRSKRFAAIRIITFFHELYATGWPWQRAYWGSRRQRAVAIRVAQCSDKLLTNREQSARWLEINAGLNAGSVVHLPVCSNVGEPDELIPWGRRAPQAVLFGGARFKETFLLHHVRMTIEACHRINVKRLIDIGTCARFDPITFQRAGISIEQMGWVAAAEVSNIYRNSKFTFIDYYPGFVAKSGVLAAAAVHGTPPIVLRSLNGETDGFYIGQHCIELPAVLSKKPAEVLGLCPTVSRLVREWYQSHSLTHHAAAMIALLHAKESQLCSSN